MCVYIYIYTCINVHGMRAAMRTSGGAISGCVVPLQGCTCRGATIYIYIYTYVCISLPLSLYIYIYIYIYIHGRAIANTTIEAPRFNTLRRVVTFRTRCAPLCVHLLGALSVRPIPYIDFLYAQSPYQHYPYQDCLTQTFQEIPYGPGNSAL